MLRQHSILIAACLGLLSPACSDNDFEDEEEGGEGTIALDLGGRMNTFWIDTDGVLPETAGCHIEFSNSSCDTVAVAPRNFGEFCQEDGTLVESNPVAGECHVHENDIGHPFVVDCDLWCRNKLKLPNGASRGFASESGVCIVVPDFPCDQVILDSARCLCR